jgi:hypothetical protein
VLQAPPSHVCPPPKVLASGAELEPELAPEPVLEPDLAPAPEPDAAPELEPEAASRLAPGPDPEPPWVPQAGTRNAARGPSRQRIAAMGILLDPRLRSAGAKPAFVLALLTG